MCNELQEIKHYVLNTELDIDDKQSILDVCKKTLADCDIICECNSDLIKSEEVIRNEVFEILKLIIN